MRRIGLIGLGSIGQLVVQAAAGLAEEVGIVAALVNTRGRSRPAGSPPCVTTLPELLAARPDVVIECAGHAALALHGPGVLRAGCDLVPASMGLFADASALASFRDAARVGESQIRIPSGAVAGIDAVLGARCLGLDSVRYRFVMSPAAWQHPVIEGSSITGRSPTESIVYQGRAAEAARKYPRHANVTATIALAGCGLERTEVEFVVDSATVRNRHEIEAVGYFGKLSVVVEGQRISEASPSSRLVAGSLLAAAVSGAPCLA
jgi:aspartate dehydrogenase